MENKYWIKKVFLIVCVLSYDIMYCLMYKFIDIFMNDML